MGPTIITDKNAIQSLSQNEIIFLFKYFYVNIPPILVREILGDLLKESYNSNSPEDNVKILARKLLSSDSGINMNYHDLILNELMGIPVKMEGRTIRASQKVSRDGEIGALIIESDEEKILRNWKDGIFSLEDYEQAQKWYSSIMNINLNEIKEMSSHIIQNLNDYNINSLDDFNNLILNNFELEKFQQNLLELIIEINKFSQEYATQIFYRWEGANKPPLKDFCPYSYYCTNALLFWNLGTLKGLFGGNTNIFDLEYIFYLPFTNIFVSNDKFHKKIIPYLIRDNQTFITGDELKVDLKVLADKWKLLNEQEKIDWHKSNGNNPTSETPLTLELCNKYFPNQKSNDYQINDEIDFMEIRRQININEPCPCKSGIPYKNCHGKLK